MTKLINEFAEPEEDPNAIDQRPVPVSEHIMENYIMQNTKNIVSEYALQAPFRNTEQNKKQKTRVKNWLASKMKGPDGAWFDFFRTMRYENETDKGFTALFLARQGLSREDIESEFSRRRATNQLKTAFSPDRGNPDVVFKKYEKEILNRLFTLYGCYVLDDMDFDSDGNLVLEFEWDGRVEGIIGNIETGEQYSMSMDARAAQGPVWKGTDPDDLLKRLKAANPKAKIRGAKAVRTASGTPPGVNEGISENKILKEYIMQNTPQQPEDISIIEIIADEVNETLNNLPEVQIASEILNEDELKDLFSPLAKQVVTKVRGQIEEEIKKLVELQVNAAQLKDAITQRLQMDPDKPVTDAEKLELLAYFTQEELEAAGIEFEVTNEEGTGPATES